MHNGVRWIKRLDVLQAVRMEKMNELRAAIVGRVLGTKPDKMARSLFC